MAISYTTNTRLQKPAASDRTWDVPLNANADQLDAMNPIGQFAVVLTEVPSASLNVRVSAGSYRKADGTIGTYAGTSSQAMTTGVTNYVYLTDGGTLTVNTSGFPSGNIVRIATVVAGASTITSITDARIPWTSKGGHVHYGVGTPTIAAGAGAGTGPTVSLVAGSSDQAGIVNVTTGTSPTANAILATITFGQVWSATPRSVVITPANAASIGVSFVPTAGLTTTAWTLNSGSSVPAASTAYSWHYQVMG